MYCYLVLLSGFCTAYTINCYVEIVCGSCKSVVHVTLLLFFIPELLIYRPFLHNLARMNTHFFYGGMNTISMNSCPSSLLLMLLVFMSLYALIVKIYQINELHPFLLKITNSCIFCKLLQLPGLSVSASEEKRGAGSTRCMLAGLDG